MYLKTFEDMQKTSVFFMLKPINAIYAFILTVCISIVAIILWAIFAPMDDVVKASVLLRPSSAISSVKCVTNGQILSKNYENDDCVKEGDLLFCLDTTVYETELEAYKKELLKNQNDYFINQTFLQAIESEKLPAINFNSDAYIKAKSYITELHRYQTVVSDSKIKLEREQKKPESIIIPQNIIDLENLLNQNELLFESWKNNQKITALETRKSLQSVKNSIESHITEIERAIKNSTICAPISGRISEVTKLNIGDYLLAGEEILRIIPQNDKKLKADIFVDPSYVARIKVGNPIKIKFPGLPPSRYGMVETEVSLVPPDVTYQNGTAVFVIEAQIDSPYLIAKNGQTAKLIPGITAEGRIVTDRSTVMQMVLRKLDFIN